MIVYVLRRVAIFLLVVFVAATLNFFLPRISGQDPIRARLLAQASTGGYVPPGLEAMVKHYDKEYGLDKPLIVQYGDYLGGVVRGNFGLALSSYPRTVSSLIADRLPWSLGLGGLATLFGFLIGSLVGAVIGWSGSPGSRFLKYLFLPLLALSAIPQFVLGLLLLLLFAFIIRAFPISGGYALATIPDWSSFSFWMDVLRHAALPALSLVLVAVGLWALGMRGLMVNMEGEDYMILAEAKGLKRSRVFLRYAVRNALLPQATGLALAMAYVVTGIILVEVVFGYPGIGSLLLQAITFSDWFLLEGIIFLIIVAVGLATLVLDLVYPLLDPRVRYRRT